MKHMWMRIIARGRWRSWKRMDLLKELERKEEVVIANIH